MAPKSLLLKHCHPQPASKREPYFYLTRLLASNLAPGDQNGFSPLENAHVSAHPYIYNFFVFAFKYKNTTLDLCCKTGGPSNENLFFEGRATNPSHPLYAGLAFQ
ncbi:unnamed protein product [Pipistrellus nathusii]|uniref:Uncharacterized protein n=1 Tax=Pipistrellus nathusii TaxID=59473 RepID=A0ABN9ZMT9_PIPNA